MALTAASLAAALRLSADHVTGIAVASGGSGYTTAPAVTVAEPPPGGQRATATATVADGAVTAIVLTDGGSGYTTAPAVTVAAPDAGATATATATATIGSAEAARLLDIADVLITAYLRGGTAPAAVRDESLIRTAGHVQDRRTFGRQQGRIKAGSVQIDLAPAGVSAVRNSGAAALLAPCVRRSA